MKKTLLVIFLLFLLSCTTLDSEEAYQQAMGLRKNHQDYEKSTRLLLYAANHDHAKSMAILGVDNLMACKEGDKIPKDDDCWKIKPNHPLGEEYLLKAAKKGDAYAISWLVTLYRGFYWANEYKDPEKAFYWAFQDQATAGGQYNIADLYKKGIGTQKDYNKAIEHFELAIRIVDEKNLEEDHFVDVWAASELANIYAEGGYGVQADCKKVTIFLKRELSATVCWDYYRDNYPKGISYIVSKKKCRGPFPEFNKYCLKEKQTL